MLPKSNCGNPNPGFPLDDHHSTQLEVIHSIHRKADCFQVSASPWHLSHT